MKEGFWQKGNSIYKLNALTVEDIKKAEDIYKITFPRAYINILKIQNGGEINYQAFPVLDNTLPGEAFIEVTNIYGIGKNPGVLDTDYLISEWDMPKGLILFNGDGHYWLAFDYRNVTVNPPIVYVNNENEKAEIIEIAKDFNEFLENLTIIEYQDKEEIEDIENQMTEYSRESFEYHLENDREDEIIEAIVSLSQTDVDITWFGQALLALTNHSNERIRSQIANSVWNFLSYRLDEDTLNGLIETFRIDPDSDVRMYAQLIQQKINYSIDDLKTDISHCLENGGYNIVSFLHDDNVYHIYRNFKLTLEGQDFTEEFSTSEELIAYVLPDGRTIEEVWSNVKLI
ncbi:SMI1/KNR4 family protein [Metabacillus malikii]|uniref:Knr4/Smi1-like domain-containing protein n=1 Tax=Metabacillus malikii TaxID=1504265 RepID=A0ABT9ZE72_9BACI|nr:SMI1/KNR4 family protein [Metabacillus malikii]MDQ0230137.1 hypothetical protein [Metabacillus malikii]